MRLCAMSLLLTIVVLGTVSAQNASKRSLVANVTDDKIIDGCGCYFKFRSTPQNAERYVFALSGDEETPWMNIDGRDVKLRQIKEPGSNGKRERVGSRSRELYASGDITVSARYVVTHICAPNDEDCESTAYDVTFVVKKGRKSQVVKAVGSCGC